MASYLYFVMTTWLSHFLPLTQALPNPEPANPRFTNVQSTNSKSTKVKSTKVKRTIIHTHLKHANLKRTTLKRTNLKRTNLTRTNSKRTNLESTNSSQSESSLCSASPTPSNHTIFSHQSDPHSNHNDDSRYDFERGPEFFPVLNSTYRSTFELLRGLPTPFDILNILPTLPTRMSTMYGLSATLPHKVTNPLPKSMLESSPPTALAVVYSRILDLRERLRVEEIISEIQPDMEQLYLDPPAYTASQLHLQDVRILIMRTCQSLAYLDRESSSHGLKIDISAINDRRIAQRSFDHPYHMISTYIKPDAWKEFHNYDNFLDLGRINGGVGVGDWDELSANDLLEDGENDSSTLDEEPLNSDDSGVLSILHIPTPSVHSSTAMVDTRHADLQPPRRQTEIGQHVHGSSEVNWRRPGMVDVGG